MKTRIITLSKTFLKGHPKEGELTNFRDKFLSGEKIHTIRANIGYWKKIIDEVNDGVSMLSIRQWSGKPYQSKMEHVADVYKLGMQKISLHDNRALVFDIEPHGVKGSCAEISINQVAKNDGLSEPEFMGWFGYGRAVMNGKKIAGIIIHFTDFRY